RVRPRPRPPSAAPQAQPGPAPAASRERLSGDRRPDDREVRVCPQCPAEPAPRLELVPEAPLDHPAMEELGRVACPEPKGALGDPQPLPALAVARQRPSQDVVRLDAR